jgi:hypothetical protein
MCWKSAGIPGSAATAATISSPAFTLCPRPHRQRSEHLMTIDCAFLIEMLQPVAMFYK